MANFLTDKIWLTSESNGVLVYFLDGGGCKMTQNRKKMADLGEWGVCPPLQNRILGKNVISQDSPGIVEKKNGEKKSNVGC